MEDSDAKTTSKKKSKEKTVGIDVPEKKSAKEEPNLEKAADTKPEGEASKKKKKKETEESTQKKEDGKQTEKEEVDAEVLKDKRKKKALKGRRGSFRQKSAEPQDFVETKKWASKVLNPFLRFRTKKKAAELSGEAAADLNANSPRSVSSSSLARNFLLENLARRLSQRKERDQFVDMSILKEESVGLTQVGMQVGDLDLALEEEEQASKSRAHAYRSVKVKNKIDKSLAGDVFDVEEVEDVDEDDDDDEEKELQRAASFGAGEGEEIRRLVKHHSLMVRQPQFGLTLREIRKRTGMSEGDVPRVIKICIVYFLRNALNVVGLFRVSGRQSKITTLKIGVEEGRSVITDSTDVHDVAGLFRMFFMELCEVDPVIPFRYYPLLLHATQIKDKKGRLDELRKILRRLPSGHLALLHHVMFCLRKVADNEEVNKMTSKNLGLIFGQSLMRPEKADMQALLMAPIQTLAIQYLIDDYHNLFQDLPVYHSDENDPADIETIVKTRAQTLDSLPSKSKNVAALVSPRRSPKTRSRPRKKKTSSSMSSKVVVEKKKKYRSKPDKKKVAKNEA